MSVLLIIGILFVPIIITIIILNRSHKKRRKNEQERLSGYLQPLLEKTGISPSFEKQLVHQYLVLDEQKSKLLVVNWKDFDFSHELHNLADLKNLSVQTVQQNVMDESNRKAESFTARVGIEMALQRTDERRFLTFYNHVEHNISQIADFTTEAAQLCERIKKNKSVKPSTV